MQAERTHRLGTKAGQAVTFVWRPSPEVVERANVTRLMRAHGIATEQELIDRSTSDVEWFWDAAIRDLGLEFFEPYGSILDTSRGIEWSTWFGGGSVNLAHNCVDRWAEHTPDATAIMWEGEEEPPAASRIGSSERPRTGSRTVLPRSACGRSTRSGSSCRPRRRRWWP